MKTTLLAMSVLLLAPRSAGAQAGFDAERFAASGTSGGFVSLEAPKADAPLYSLGMQASFVDLPLTLLQGGLRSEVVTSRSTLAVTATLAPLRNLELGVVAPFVTEQTGMTGSLLDARGSGPGDLRLIPKWTLLDGTFGLALLAPVRLPTGDANKFLGYGQVIVEPTLAMQLRAGRLRAAVNGGLRPTADRMAFMTHLGDQWFGGVATGVHVTRSVEMIGEARFATDTRDAFTYGNTPVELVGGVRYDTGSWALLAGGGAGVLDGWGASRARAFVQASFTPSLPEIHPLPVAHVQAQAPAPEHEETPEADPVRPEVEALVTNEEIVMLHPIFFETNHWDIQDRFVPQLEELQRVLEDWPGMQRVRIEGHADATGPHHWNVQLSQRRAEAICDWLVAHGINPARLIPMGFAEDRPWTDNDTRLGRARNRRVMFFIERWADGADRPDAVVTPKPEEVQP